MLTDPRRRNGAQLSKSALLVNRVLSACWHTSEDATRHASYSPPDAFRTPTPQSVARSASSDEWAVQERSENHPPPQVTAMTGRRHQQLMLRPQKFARPTETRRRPRWTFGGRGLSVWADR